MRDNIIPFNQNDNDEDDYCCPFCDLTNEYLMYILDAESVEEKRNILRELVGEASRLTLMEFLENEIDNNEKLLDKLKYGDFED